MLLHITSELIKTKRRQSRGVTLQAKNKHSKRHHYEVFVFSDNVHALSPRSRISRCRNTGHIERKEYGLDG